MRIRILCSSSVDTVLEVEYGPRLPNFMCLAWRWMPVKGCEKMGDISVISHSSR